MFNRFFCKFSHTVMAVALCSSVVGCSTYKPVPLGVIPPAVMPSGEEVQTTRSSIESMSRHDGAEGLVTSGPQYQRVSAIYDRLTTAIEITDRRWPLFLVKSEEANASAVNRNSIVVYTGLLDKLTDDDHVAAVLGHEISHILAQHEGNKSAESNASIVSAGGRVLGTLAAVAAAYGGLGRAGAGAIGSVTASAATVIGTGMVLQFSRDQEYDADRIGIMIMAKAGYNPEKAMDLWQNADELFSDGHGGGFLSTHPSDSARASALDEALPVAKSYFQQAQLVKVANVSAKSGAVKRAKGSSQRKTA